MLGVLPECQKALFPLPSEQKEKERETLWDSAFIKVHRYNVGFQTLVVDQILSLLPVVDC
jgi:hypothetical protein